MANENELQVKITSETSGLKSGTQEAASTFADATAKIQSSVNSMNTNVSTATSGFGKFGEGLISGAAKIGVVSAAIYGLTGGLKAFVNEAAEAETIERRLQFAMETAGYGWKDAKAAVDSFANSIMETTRFSDEDARRALTDMMLYTNEYAKAELGAKLAMDMSIRTGRDLSTTTRLIGMALTGNVEMLGRYLPQLRNLDAVLGADATQAEKAAYALKVLQEKFSGTAAKDLDTYSGRVANLKNQWKEFQEELGAGLLPILTKILKTMTDIIESARKVSAFKLREQTYEMGINPETGLPFRVPGGRTPEAYPKESERRFTGWGMGAAAPKDKLPQEDYSSIIKKQADEAAKAWGEYAQAELDALDKMFKDSADSQIEANKYKNERILAGELDFEEQMKGAILGAYDAHIAVYEADQKAAEEERARRTEALEFEIRLNDEAVESKIRETQRKGEIGKISALEEVNIIMGLTQEKYSFELDLLEKIKTLWQEYPEEWRKIEERIKLLKQKYNNDMKKVDDKFMMDFKNTFTSVMNSITSSFASTIVGLINGTMTWSQAVNNILNSILSTFINMFLRILTEWIATEISALLFTRTTQTTKAATSITASAAVGAAAAAAANAETAYGAALAGAEMYAQIMAFLPMAFAKEGWDVDQDSLAYLHKNEMVLPAGIAEGFRTMIAGGGGPTGSPSQQRVTVNYNLQQWDTAGMKRMLIRTAPTIASVLRNHGRSYGIR